MHYFQFAITLILLKCIVSYEFNSQSSEYYNERPVKANYKPSGQLKPEFKSAINTRSNDADLQTNQDVLRDAHSSAALLDLVFTDGLRYTCTGAVIHRLAVLSLAHCFVYYLPDNEPELILSFIILGKKSYYANGYERYVGIERVLAFPDYNKDWENDIAIVYSSDPLVSVNPGKIINIWPNYELQSDKKNSLTVISWGKVKKMTTVHDAPYSTSSKKVSHGKNSKKHTTKCRRELEENKYVTHLENSRRLLNLEKQLMKTEYTAVDISDCLGGFEANSLDRNYSKLLCFMDKNKAVTEGDAGALVVENNSLVGLTLGYIEYNHKTFGVAVRLSCFCDWIKENLPDQQISINCCKNCCRPKVTKAPTTKPTTTTQPTTTPTTMQSIKETSSKPTYKPTTTQSSKKSTKTPSYKPTTMQSSEETTYKPTYKPTATQSSKETTYKPTFTQSSEETTYKPTYKPTATQSSEETTYKPTFTQSSEETTYKPTYKPTTTQSSEETTYKSTYKPTTEQSSEETTYKPTYEPTNTQSSEETTYKSTYKPTTEHSSEETTYKPTYEPTTMQSSEETTYKPTTTQSSEETTMQSNEETTYKPTYKPTNTQSSEETIKQSSEETSYKPAYKPTPTQSNEETTEKLITSQTSRETTYRSINGRKEQDYFYPEE